MPQGATINLEQELEKLGSMSREDLLKTLTEIKTKQKVTQKKYYNPETAKESRLRRAAKQKAMEEFAKTQPADKPGFANLYEQILADAAAQADIRLMAEDVEWVESDN